MSKNRFKKTEMRVYFSVYTKDIPPKNLTELIGLKPSKIHFKGEPLVKNNPKSYRHKENLWEVKSQLSSTADLGSHIANVLNQLRPYKEKIIKETRGMYKELAITIFYAGERPGIHIDRNVVKEIDEYEVEIDFDIYLGG